VPQLVVIFALPAQRPKPKPPSSKPEDKRGDAAAAGGGAKAGGGYKAKRVERDAEARGDWGELNTGKQPPAVFVLDVATGAVAAVPGQREDATYGQPSWAPNNVLLLVCASMRLESLKWQLLRLAVSWTFAGERA
jgi:Acylamino-acid-releasing enzyme, N-terminal domain